MLALAECTTEEAARLARRKNVVVLLPLGAIEQHGPHLPLAVDWLGAEALARHLAPHLERSGYPCVLAPSLPAGAAPSRSAARRCAGSWARSSPPSPATASHGSCS